MCPCWDAQSVWLRTGETVHSDMFFFGSNKNVEIFVGLCCLAVDSKQPILLFGGLYGFVVNYSILFLPLLSFRWQAGAHLNIYGQAASLKSNWICESE